MKKILGVLLAVCLMATTILSGCSEITVTKTKTGELDADQTINLLGNQFSSLDPSAVNDVDSFTTLSHVNECLFREAVVNGENSIVLAGASKMDVSADGTVYTFTIRDNKWSDGKSVSAKDYEFSWKRLINPENAFDYMHFLDSIKGVPEFIAGTCKLEDVGIKALDDKTLQLTLTKPIDGFEKRLIFCCLSPQREDKFNELGEQYGVGTEYAKMVYNGPFVISEYQKEAKIVYTKNEQYWDAANIKITKAVCPIVNEPATIFQMFQAKQFDAMGASNKDLISQLANIAKSGDIYHITGSQASTFFYVFNFKNKYLANVNVRKALSLAINREEMLKVLWDRFIPAYGMVPSGLLVGDKNFRSNVDEPLKQVMTENKDPKAVLMEGLKELNITDPSTVTITLYSSKATTNTKAQTEYAQKQWQDKLGIKIDIKFALDTNTYYSDRAEGNFDLITGGWGSDYNDVFSMLEFLRSDNPNNDGKYNNPRFDELVNNALYEPDPDKRMSNFKEAEELLIAKDFALAPYYYSDVQSYAHKYLNNISYPVFTGRISFRDAFISGKN
ncbi:MAG: hypothetical protein K0R09_1737 [Clostridiales bacterium]|jgi:oligopeptide transport system substrate-binding protein|nr:hypothetical protein [Clostridiales bacterium]